ncbi:glyoxalase superfamily protein [Burkholderia cenocepacia]|uniref:TraG/VirB4 family ATPase n=1 Tax=Burkholderia cenocepacia TaxID=95486 RepID=UPI00076DCCB3|nr:glyoxalase superfamily protein [Burkholderia cenocepacia]KWU26448.1 hypothetical protein AS149_26020 [Burkholderia cenocepacia]
MDFSPNVLRLDTCLCAADVHLQPAELGALEAVLAKQTAAGHLQALKQAAHQLRHFLREHRHLIKQSLAFEMLARYLGHPDWNTARQLAPTDACALKNASFAREGFYAFEIFDKGRGVANIVAGLESLARRLPEVARLRLLSDPRGNEHILDHWRSQDKARQPLAGALNDSRRHWLRSAIRQARPLSGATLGLRVLRHFVLVELTVPAAGKRWTYETLGDELQTLFQCRLRVPGAETLGVFGNLQAFPEGFVQWTAIEPAAVSNDWLTRQAAPCVTVFDFEGSTTGARLVRYGVGLSEHDAPAGDLEKWLGDVHASGVRLSQDPPTRLGVKDYAGLLASSWLAEGALAHPTGGIPVVSRAGCIGFLDLWAKRAQEQRPPFFLISAVPGSGKSYLANELIVDTLSQHRSVRIVDFSRSYMKLADLLGGERIDFSETAPFSLNLFGGISHAGRLKELLPLWAATLCQLVPCPAHVVQPLMERLGRSWQQHREALGVPQLVDGLLLASDIELVRVGAALQRLYLEHHAWFDGPSILQDRKDAMLVLNAEPLDLSMEAGRVVVPLLMANLAQEALLSPQPMLYLLDDTWGVGKAVSASFSKALLSCFAQGSHAVGATVQSFDEMLEVPFSRQLFQRSTHLLLLKQRHESLAKFATLPSSPYARLFEGAPESRAAPLRNGTGSAVVAPSDGLFEELCTVDAGRGYLSVAVLTPDKYQGVYQFAVDEFSNLAYTTRIQEHRRYMDLRNRGNTPLEAVTLQVAEAERARKSLSA